jgi:hypothetical protein
MGPTAHSCVQPPPLPTMEIVLYTRMDAINVLCTYAKRLSEIFTTLSVRYDIRSSQISVIPSLIPMPAGLCAASLAGTLRYSKTSFTHTPPLRAAVRGRKKRIRKKRAKRRGPFDKFRSV